MVGQSGKGDSAMLEGLMEKLRGIDLEDPSVVTIMLKRPDIEPGENDEFIGQVDEQLLKLRILIIQQTDQLERLMRKYHADDLDPDTPDHTDEDHASFLAQIKPLEDELEDLNTLFWSILRLDFHLSGVGQIAVTNDWRIFKMAPQPEPRDMSGMMVRVLTMSGPDDMAELLSALGGGRQRRHGHDGGCSGGCH